MAVESCALMAPAVVVLRRSDRPDIAALPTTGRPIKLRRLAVYGAAVTVTGDEESQ
jgi:hypothetical protein